MKSSIVSSILNRVHHPELFEILSNQLSGTELNSILLEVYSQRTQRMTPADVLNLYQQNRFVKPTDLPVIETKRMELEILERFQEFSFEPLELSPVSIQGSCSVIAPADQKKILTALRGTEVLADSTNAIALHVCDLKQKKGLPDIKRFCNIQRQIRTQAISEEGFTPHFRIGCLVTCATDTGNFHFEKTALNEHIQVMKDLFLDYYKVDEMSFRLLGRDGYPEGFLKKTGDHLRQMNPGINILMNDKPEKEILYYRGIQYKVDILYKGKTYEIADGGFVDWTQRLLQNKKERMLSTGFGFDLMLRILRGEI